jgi:hypothetical protein
VPESGRKRWRLTFVLSAAAFVVFEAIAFATGNLTAKILCTVVALVYLLSAIFSFRKATVRG